jgi:two-component system sensor histidine kinase CreC
MTIRFGLLACAALGLLASAALGEDEAPRSDSVNNVSAQVTILQNAIEFSSPDATVTVPVEREGKTVVVRILDEGPGIPAYALNKVFDRFYSLPQPGTGNEAQDSGFVLLERSLIYTTALLWSRTARTDKARKPC